VVTVAGHVFGKGEEHAGFLLPLGSSNVFRVFAESVVSEGIRPSSGDISAIL
jgi:hypothetical protein